jgi:hypothetical protein
MYLFTTGQATAMKQTAVHHETGGSDHQAQNAPVLSMYLLAES